MLLASRPRGLCGGPVLRRMAEGASRAVSSPGLSHGMGISAFSRGEASRQDSKVA